jgi:hypothetical protein
MKATLAKLETLHEGLITALDANDPAAIGDASRALDESLAELRGFDTWLAEPELKLAAERIARLAEAAAMRVNLLNDQARRRSQALASLRGETVTATYSR